MNYNVLNSYFGINLEGMFQDIENSKKEQYKKSVGIEYKDGYYGNPSKNIDFIYDSVSYKDDYLFFKKTVEINNEVKNLTDIYLTDGTFIIETDGYDYLGRERFILDINKNKEKYGYLYHNDKKLSDELVRLGGLSSLNKDYDYIILLHKDFKNIILDINDGKTLFKTESSFDYLSATSESIFSYKNSYYNVWTGELICKPHYSSSSKLTSNDHIFVQVADEMIYQINKKTCEVIIHGQESTRERETREREEENKILDEKRKLKQEEENKKKKDPKVIVNRNDKCSCGSGKKYKNCCINGKK